MIFTQKNECQPNLWQGLFKNQRKWPSEATIRWFVEGLWTRPWWASRRPKKFCRVSANHVYMMYGWMFIMHLLHVHQTWTHLHYSVTYTIHHRHTEYTDEHDGTKRCRVRFNIEGQFGKAFVFAEQSSDMPAGEMVYGTISFHVLILCCCGLIDKSLKHVFSSPRKYSCKTKKMDECLLWWIIELQLQQSDLLEEINKAQALCKIFWQVERNKTDWLIPTETLRQFQIS